MLIEFYGKECPHCLKMAPLVGELRKNLGITKVNASQHLAIMRGQSIVKTRREGITILYSLSNPKILVAYDALRKALKEQLETNGKLLEKF